MGRTERKEKQMSYGSYILKDTILDSIELWPLEVTWICCLSAYIICLQLGIFLYDRIRGQGLEIYLQQSGLYNDPEL